MIIRDYLRYLGIALIKGDLRSTQTKENEEDGAGPPV